MFSDRLAEEGAVELGVGEAPSSRSPTGEQRGKPSDPPPQWHMVANDPTTLIP